MYNPYVLNFRAMKSDGANLSLNELVAKANELLPRYLSETGTDARVRDVVNARLVRHLTTLGLLDEALREGREARYAPRHLLQLLVTRRLMSEGLTTGAIKKLVADAEDVELQGLLYKGARLASERETSPLLEEVPETNAALDFLRGLKSRDETSEGKGAMPMRRKAATSSTRLSETAGERWTRLEIAPGLEVHVREDFRVPPTPHERDNLLQAIWQKINVKGRTK